MHPVRVGVQLQPQHTTTADLRRAWQEADALGFDTIWTWDHFFPLSGDQDGSHFEGWSLLAAMAVDTQRAKFGMLVTCNSYRNPELLVDMARTIDHLSGGRLILGIGAGWFQRDYREYGYEFGTKATRVRALEESLERIAKRRAVLNPPPIDLPLLIGASGEQVMLRLVAEHAQLWNSFGPAETYARKSAVLDEWCEKVGRDPGDIERTVAFDLDEIPQAEQLLEVGATHLICGLPHPFDFDQLRPVLALRQ